MKHHQLLANIKNWFENYFGQLVNPFDFVYPIIRDYQFKTGLDVGMFYAPYIPLQVSINQNTVTNVATGKTYTLPEWFKTRYDISSKI